jgi:hypothetical protein
VVQVLRQMIDGFLEEYDSESKQPMRLVLFMDAIEHVSRINRILRLALGNALLCGVGGSGRKSLTKLAAFMADYKAIHLDSSGPHLNDDVGVYDRDCQELWSDGVEGGYQKPHEDRWAQE